MQGRRFLRRKSESGEDNLNRNHSGRSSDPPPDIARQLQPSSSSQNRRTTVADLSLSHGDDGTGSSTLSGGADFASVGGTIGNNNSGGGGSSSRDNTDRKRDRAAPLPHTPATTTGTHFVTQPPRMAKGLTGKISTLFRRESSRGAGGDQDGSHHLYYDSDAVVPAVLLQARGSSTLGGAAAPPRSPGSSMSQQRGRSSGEVSSGTSRHSHHSTTNPNSPDSEAPLPPNRWSPTRRSRSADRPAAATTTATAVAAAAAPSVVAKGTVSRSSRRLKTSAGHQEPRSSGSPSGAQKQPGVSSKLRRQSSTGKRIFYSSHQDDDSDDSYESRVSTASRGSRGDRQGRPQPPQRNSHRGSTSAATVESEDHNTRSLGTTTGDYSTSYTDGSGAGALIKRYRGFSTSIKSLFLDESLVCGACGCFGLILSSRTEYLLQLRNERRGVAKGSGSRRNKRSIMPSRIIATGLALALVLMFSTFIIWGFGKGDGVAQNYLNGYDYHDDAVRSDDGSYNSNNDDKADDAAANDDQNDNAEQDGEDRRQYGRALDQQIVLDSMDQMHRPLGIFKIRDYQEYLWDPISATIRNEWYQENESEKSAAIRNEWYQENESEEFGGLHRLRHRLEEDGTATNDGYAEFERDLASDIRAAIFICFLLFLGVLGRRRRMRTRFYLVRARAQEDHLYYASSDEAAARRVAFDDAREDQYEGACSHTLCGCYPVDEVDNTVEDENVQVSDSGLFRRKVKPHNEDIVARSFNCFMATCCGYLCSCWFQCLSICALAQEAREVRLLIPPRYQRIDYITHQPFHEYQEAVNDLRRGWMGKARIISGFLPHYNALSRLSRYIIIASLVTVLSILGTLLFNPRAAFSWQDAVVLVATFLQAFLVLFFVHWIFHKSDLSLDAVVKLFAAGFLIAVPTAFFFEGLLINLGYFATFVIYDSLAYIFGDNFSDWVNDNWRVISMIGELFNAFVVAAVTEELCKYYTFRCVEHPDLVFLTGLQRDTQEDDAVDGGLVKYPFASHQVQELSRSRSFTDDLSASEHSHRSNRSRSRERQSRRSDTLLEQTGTTDAEFDEDERDVRTRRQKAMAITTGMISVAVGLACAENFLYVFVLGGAVGDNSTKNNLLEAWIVLFFRSIFPVHALAAAMQSINMIRKFVEFDNHNGHRVGVGRIILPAVIVHGSFDAVLMGINVYVETALDKYIQENGGIDADALPYNALVVNLVAWTSIIGIMLAGLFWYYRENRMQRDRLKVLEEQDKAFLEKQWMAGRCDDEDDL